MKCIRGYTRRVTWEINLHPEVEKWFLALAQDAPEIANQVAAAIDMLAEDGPSLSRPMADRIKASRHHHMKELRPRTSSGTEIRLLFAFDPERQALVLVAGDKHGNWKRWYAENIPIADARFDEHLSTLQPKGKKS